MKITNCPFALLKHYSHEGIWTYHTCFANYLISCNNKPEVTKEQFDSMTIEEKNLEWFDESENFENLEFIGNIPDYGYLPVKDFIKALRKKECPIEQEKENE